MDWFERLTGFAEGDYRSTQRRLVVDGDELASAVDGKRRGVGELSLPILADLRARVEIPQARRSTVECVAGDARALHAAPEFEGALFQVASQFNLLEMASPEVTPEAGVSGYAHDRTQGPACAMAAGAATIYRNYCVPVDGARGQTRDRQLDALAHMGAALSSRLQLPVARLWRMQNGYALCTQDGLATIAGLLDAATDELREVLRGHLAIGVHRGVEVTDVSQGLPRRVSQAFCSALPVAYTSVSSKLWEPFARLVLEAAYEATLLAAVEQAGDGGSKTVLLTRLGGGVFGNDARWITEAIVRALAVIEYAGLDIRLVSFGDVHPAMRQIADDWG